MEILKRYSGILFFQGNHQTFITFSKMGSLKCKNSHTSSVADSRHRCSSRLHQALGKQLPLQFRLVMPAVQKLHTSSLTNVVENMLKQAGFSFREQRLMSISWRQPGLAGLSVVIGANGRFYITLNESQRWSERQDSCLCLQIEDGSTAHFDTTGSFGLHQKNKWFVCLSHSIHFNASLGLNGTDALTPSSLKYGWSAEWMEVQGEADDWHISVHPTCSPSSGVHRNPSYCACYNYSSQRSRPLIKLS